MNTAAKKIFNPNSLLLLCLILVVFFVPVLSAAYHTVAYDFLFSCIFILSALAIKFKGPKNHLGFALALIILIWAAFKIELSEVSLGVRIAIGCSFLFAVIRLIQQTAAAKDVNVRVIADSISGYLLIGIIYTLIAYSISNANPDAYHFPEGNNFDEQTRLSKMFYYTFVTYSSTGYGDITPYIPVSRSFSTLISVTGQMYVAIIIALLVGKFSSNNKND